MRGQKDSNLRAFYRLWFSRPAHSSALPCPLTRFVWRRLYDLRAEHLSSGARASSGGAQCSCVVTGEMRRGVKRRLREPVSGLTHLVGGLLALIALIVLLTKVAGGLDCWV